MMPKPHLEMSIASALMVTGLAFAWPIHAATPLGPATFGNPDRPWGTRRPVTAADRALVASYRSADKKAVIDTHFTKPAELQSQWDLQSDDNAWLKSCRRPENVVITADELQLRTLSTTNCKAKWSTGSMISKLHQKFGFFESSMKAANISGLNNAFWLTTEDHFEIDIAEVHYPNIVRLTLHNNNDWATIKDDKMHAVGFESKFSDNFSQAYHDYGVLWTPTDIIYEVDGEPIAAITTHGTIHGAAEIRFSTAVTEYGGKIPANPAGHNMYVKSLRVVPWQ